MPPHLRSSDLHAAFAAFQSIFSFLITALFGFLQIHYQSKSISPLDTHPALFLASLAALLLYSYLAVAYIVNPTPWHRHTLMAFTAYLFAATLVSLLYRGRFYFLLYPLPILALLSSVPLRGFNSQRAPPSPSPLLPVRVEDTRAHNELVSRIVSRGLWLMAARDPLQNAERRGLALLLEEFDANSPRSLLLLSPFFSGGFIHRSIERVFSLLQVMLSSGRALPPPPTLLVTDANAHSSE